MLGALMKTDKAFDYVFTIVPKSTPQIIRRCARCEANRFASSNKFRINANKKVLDVWLIFKCIACDYTLNVSIFSRKSIKSIDRILLERFYKNDIELSWQYAFDPSYIERNMIVDWGIEFDILSQKGILDDCEPAKDTHDRPGMVLLHLRSHFFLKMSIVTVLRKILNLSRSALEKMQLRGEIEIDSFQSNHKPLTLKGAIGVGCNVRIGKEFFHLNLSQ